MKRLFYVLRGIRRVQGSSYCRVPRQPFTLRHLMYFLSFTAARFNTFDNLMLRAVACVAFFALLRSAEYTSKSATSWDPSSDLSVCDVFWGKTGDITLFIKASKTDPFKSGVRIQLTRLNSPLCPVTALREYLAVRGLSGPLFVFSDGSHLTRHRLSGLIQQCFPNMSLDTHSFRIGGASLAAQSGIPPLLMQKMGRWRSTAFLRYIYFDDDSLREAQRRMVARPVR